MNNNELYQNLRGEIVISTGLIVVAIDAMTGILYSQLVQSFNVIVGSFLIAIMMCGYLIGMMGFAMKKDGYCRAFWQLLGRDFSIAQEGDTA